MLDADVSALAARVLAQARARSLRLATAESCTGGLVAAALTEIAGASDVFDRGWVSYSNAAKSDLLGVAPDLIASNGAVSAEVARAMAEGAIARSDADLAVAITGVAGPGGGTATKPVGLVWFGLAERSGVSEAFERRCGELGRQGVRLAAVRAALQALSRRLE